MTCTEIFSMQTWEPSSFVDAGREWRLCMCFGFEIEWPHLIGELWLYHVFFWHPLATPFPTFNVALALCLKTLKRTWRRPWTRSIRLPQNIGVGQLHEWLKDFLCHECFETATRRPHSFDKICFKEMGVSFLFFFQGSLHFKGKLNQHWVTGLSRQGDEERVLDDFEDVELKKQHCMLGVHSRRLHLTHFNKISPSIPCLVGSKNLPFQPSKKDYKATDGPWFVCVADSEDLEGKSLRQTTRWGNEGVGHTVLECSISPRVRYRSFL